MIKLTRLGGEEFILNAELIKYLEARPDTFVTLTTGERLVVQQSLLEVMQLAVAYQRSKHLLPPPAPHSPSTDNGAGERFRHAAVAKDRDSWT
ncbi:MAG: flagellar FlbD family protein [Pirellulaceae bacterium]